MPTDKHETTLQEIRTGGHGRRHDRAGGGHDDDTPISARMPPGGVVSSSRMRSRTLGRSPLTGSRLTPGAAF